MHPAAPLQRSRVRKFLVLVLSTFVGLLLAEGGYRTYRALRGTTYRRADVEARLDGLIDELRGVKFVPEAAQGSLFKVGMAVHPYQGYQIAQQTRRGQENARYFASPEAQSNFDIVLIGGSVAAMFGNMAGKLLFPTLEKDPRLAGRPIRLHSVACPGHKQPQHTMTLQWLLSQGWRPDAVILLDGFNELAVSADNAKVGVNPLFPYWIEMQMRLGTAISDPADMELVGSAIAARQDAESLRESLRSWPLTRSAITGTWALGRLERAANRARERVLAVQEHEKAKSQELHSLTIGGPGFDSDPAAVLSQCVEAWREGSRSMQAICRARGIPFLHVLQPSACDAGSKPLTPEELEAAKYPPLWAETIARGYPRLREVGAELAREGIGFLDATQIFAGHSERIYLDSCHFQDAGAEILGPLMAEAFLRAWKP